MNNFKYKIGDRVIASDNICQHKKCPGTIVELWYTSDHPTPYAVKFDGEKYSMWSEVHELIVPEPKIVITTDGTKITTATLYEDGKKVKTATAKCCLEDTFDFMVGAKLACERLSPKKEVTKYKVGDRIFAEDNVGEYPGGAWGTVVNVLDKRFHKEDYLVRFDADYTLCSHVVSVPTTPEKPKEETEWRVVNRTVRDGDYIRITRPTFSFDNHGDILRVSFVRKDGIVVIYAKDHPNETNQTGNFKWYYCGDGYEVVEKVTKTEELSKPVEFNITKPYNGKVVCIDNCYNETIYTVGKVYEFVDGQMTANDGVEYPGNCSTITSFDEWARWTSSKFIPFVED